MINYIIVIFKNKVRKKIIKKFVSYDRAMEFYSKFLSKSNEIIFDKIIDSGKEVNYELGLISLSNEINFPTYIRDSFGRNKKVKLEDDGMSILSISPYKYEDKIFDIQKNKKIDAKKLMSDYLSSKDLKIVFSLNNKIVIQNDSKFSIFSLKNESESKRFIDCLSNYYFINKKKDCMFIKDDSSAQKKYLFDVLESNGFDKKMLYRKYTTYPK